MFKIVKKRVLNPTVTQMDISAPLVANNAEPGQFIILRVDDEGERIPLTIADYDREAGTVSIIFQVVGATTEKLNHLNEGDSLADFVGPLGNATETEGYRKVAVVGGGVGCAIALPVAKKFHECGAEVTSIVGFRNKDLVILEEEFKACSTKFVMMTDDGSYGTKGMVTNALEELIKEGVEREIVSKIQNMRKDAGFEVTDRIAVYYKAEGRSAKVFERAAFAKDVLADSIASGEAPDVAFTKEQNINGEHVTISLVRR